MSYAKLAFAGAMMVALYSPAFAQVNPAVNWVTSVNEV